MACPKRISFKKLDIEGSEIPALYGGSNIIRNHHPIIMIELQQAAQRRAGSSSAELWDHLGSLGYTLAVFDGAGQLTDKVESDDRHVNYVARPTSEAGEGSLCVS